jgi:hypothetical protein
VAGRHGATRLSRRRIRQVPHRRQGLVDGGRVVINTVGPFAVTAPQVARACPPGTHYVDVANELSAFELLHGMDRDAAATGRTLVSGAGFGVLATESILLHLLAGEESLREYASTPSRQSRSNPAPSAKPWPPPSCTRCSTAAARCGRAGWYVPGPAVPPSD